MDTRGEYIVQLLVAILLFVHGYHSIISSIKFKETSIDPCSLISLQEPVSFIESRIPLSQTLGTGLVQPLIHDSAHASFEQYSKSHPFLPALEFNSRATSYSALNTDANYISDYIMEYGVARGEYIAIISKVTVEMIAAMLGVLKSGGAFIPIDSSLPTSRILYMLDTCKCKLVLVQDGFKLDGFCNLCEISKARTASTFPAPLISRKDPAYVIFTSGRVTIAHESFSSFINATPNLLCTTIGNRVAQLASPSFDMCLAEIFCTLSKGATLVLKDQADPFKQTVNVDIMIATPTLLSKLDPALHPNLKFLVSGGEALSHSIAKKWSHVLLLNAYGPTEITIACAMGVVDPDDSIVTIGNAYPNSRLYIVDENLQLVEDGVAGELVVGGIGVALGYVAQADLTAERFFDDPFTFDGSRIYKTGDMCKWTADGKLQYLGRNDDMVKIKGFRVELEEVSNGIERCKLVTGATVVAHESNLIAFVTPGSLDVDKLRAQVSEILPHYMCPAAIMAIEELPRTSSEKTDKRALLKMYDENRAAITASAEMSWDNNTASKIKAIWSSVLGCSESIITRNTSFFEIGGDSMSCIVVLNKLEPLLPPGKQININTLYRFQTIDALAACIDGVDTEWHRINWEQEYSIVNSWITSMDIAQLQPAVQNGDIILTGATGFLGSHILAHLLSLIHPPHIVCVAVRGTCESAAVERVREKLRKFHLYSPKLARSFREHVKVCHGDLCSPKLGMQEPLFEKLCANAKYVIHTAAALSHLHSYSRLKNANVLSLEWIVKLACSKTLKQIHFVSTIGVCELVPSESELFGKEQIFDFVDPDSSGPGYVASKWCGEMIFNIAGQLGVPISIYRPSYITAHSTHGICNPIGSIDMIMRSIIETKVFPALEAEYVDLVPVDFCAASVVTAALTRDNSFGVQVYHSNNPNFVSWREIFALMKKTLPEISLASVEEFIDRLGKVDGSDVIKALFEADSESFIKPFGCERMKNAVGLVCPPVNHELFEVYTAASWE